MFPFDVPGQRAALLADAQRTSAQTARIRVVEGQRRGRVQLRTARRVRTGAQRGPRAGRHRPGARPCPAGFGTRVRKRWSPRRSSPSGCGRRAATSAAGPGVHGPSRPPNRRRASRGRPERRSWRAARGATRPCVRVRSALVRPRALRSGGGAGGTEVFVTRMGALPVRLALQPAAAPGDADDHSAVTASAPLRLARTPVIAPPDLSWTSLETPTPTAPCIPSVARTRTSRWRGMLAPEPVPVPGRGPSGGRSDPGAYGGNRAPWHADSGNRRFSESGVPIEPVYGPGALRGWDPAERNWASPETYPYTRGVHPSMYTGRPGRCASTPASGRRRSPTSATSSSSRTARRALHRLRPADPDGPRLRRAPRPRRGRQGGRRHRLRRRHARPLRRDPAEEVSTSMTINAPAALLLLMYSW